MFGMHWEYGGASEKKKKKCTLHTTIERNNYRLTLFIFLFFPGCLNTEFSSSVSSPSLHIVMTVPPLAVVDHPLLLTGKLFVPVGREKKKSNKVNASEKIRYSKTRRRFYNWKQEWRWPRRGKSSDDGIANFSFVCKRITELICDRNGYYKSRRTHNNPAASPRGYY